MTNATDPAFPESMPIPMGPAPEEPVSLRDALHSIRATGRLNTGDVLGYVAVLRQMADALDDEVYAEHAETLETMRRKGVWLLGWAQDWIVAPRRGPEARCGNCGARDHYRSCWVPYLDT